MSIERQRGGFFQCAAPDVSYRATLERLRGQRSAPALEPHYTIGGEIEREVHREIDEERETSITQMEHRFRETRGHAMNEFAISKLRGLAERDFERGR